MLQSNLKEELPPEALASKGLVLIVDDEPSIAQTLSAVLQDEGYQVLLAEDGAAALKSLKEHSPSVVFLDIWMPGVDGIETLEQIKKIKPATEVIMISGHATIANALEATKRGACDFLEKPLSIKSVLHALDRAMQKIAEARSSTASQITQSSRGSQSVLSSKGIGPEGLRNINPELRNNYTHPTMLSTCFSGRNLGQRTLKRSHVMYGQCLHSGQKSGLVLEPLPANSGIHFARIGGVESVPAQVDYVDSTDLATTLRTDFVTAATIEHLLAALSAYRISNLLIKCNGEVPIFDGSAREFCQAIESVGIKEQGGEWYEIALAEAVSYRSELKARVSGVEDRGEEQLLIEPGSDFRVIYELDYVPPVGKQKVEFLLDSPESFKEQIAPARTFGFLRDIERLQRAGLAAGGRLDNFILIGPDKVLNTDLRFPDELARHKCLDIIGDLSLLGRPLVGTVRARMTGHSDNINLLRAISSLLK